MSDVLLQSGPAGTVEGYRALCGDAPIRLLEALVRRLHGRRLVMINSTSTGGGVAEILHRLVPLLRELGVPTSWQVMPGDARFYDITKRIHNALHGWPATLDDDDREYFYEVNRAALRELDLGGDLVMVHDPQPAVLAALARGARQHWVWRCHIDLARADPAVWSFLEPFVLQHDAAVFSHPDFVPALPIPAYICPPSIDPMSDKNRDLDEDECEALLAPLGLPESKPWVTQVSRFDRIKDPLGVIQAFALARRGEDAQLVLAGGSADDDPEGAQVLAEVRERAARRRDVSVLELPPDAHLTINALQRRSAVIVQKSLREGFALTVSEALWKRRAVVASAVGGIPLQVLHEHTGLLVHSVEGCASQITRLLRHAPLRRRLGIAGHIHVREHFLHPREARDYLAVFVRLLETAARAVA